MNKFEEFFFTRPIGKNGNALFKRPSDLAKAMIDDVGSDFFIANNESEEYKKKLNSTKVYLSKVMNSKINPSDEFVNSIKHVVKKNIPEHKDAQILLDELHRLLGRSAYIFTSINEESELDELNRRYGKSRSHIVFISRPVETYNNSRAEKFIEAILNSLFHFSTTVSILDEPSRYEFHFAHPLIGFEFFNKIVKYASEKMGHSYDKEQMEPLFEEVNKKLFKLFEVNELFCTLPTALFNATSQDASGFVFFSHDSTRFSIAKMSDAAINRWYKNIYLHAKFTRREITFGRYKETIKNSKSGQAIDEQNLLKPGAGFNFDM